MEAAKGSPPSLKGSRVVERMCWSENGKAPHANQEPSRMGNGGQVRIEQPEQRHKPAVGAPELEFCFRSVQTSKPAWL
jgi:hypothetical protein